MTHSLRFRHDVASDLSQSCLRLGTVRLIYDTRNTMRATPLILASLIASPFVFAGEAPKTVIEVEPEKSWCERLWEYPVLYKNKETFIQEFRLIGRFHGDVYEIDSAQGHDQDWVVRRLRIGGVLKLQGNLELKGEVQFDPQFDNPWYSGLTEASLTWKPSEAFNLKIGKIPMIFTRDAWYSSNNLQTLERNNLSNNLWFPQRYFTGVTVSGKIENWLYYAGVVSSDVNEEFGDFDASAFGVASIGYDFTKMSGAKKAVVRLDYMYQDVHPNAVNTRAFEHVASLNFDYERERWGVAGDFAAGAGHGRQGDVWGLMVMPWYKINDQFELVARYTHLESDDNDSIRLNRYENRITSGRGDKYDEFYVGLNYYICGHKLKLQTGLTYAMMDDAANNGGEYEGWSWVSGLRFSF
jgi:phosphate-selective porin OprO and OprP